MFYFLMSAAGCKPQAAGYWLPALSYKPQAVVTVRFAPRATARLPPTAHRLPLTRRRTATIPALSALGQHIVIMHIIGKNLAPQSLHRYPGEHKPYQNPNCRKK